MTTFQVVPSVFISRPDPPSNSPPSREADVNSDKIAQLSQLSFEFLDASSPALSCGRSWSSLSFTRGPPSELDLANNLGQHPRPKEEVTALPLLEASHEAFQELSRPKPKYEPEDPCLPKPGSINDIAYFLKNTGPSSEAEDEADRGRTVDFDRDSMSERTSTRGSSFRDKLGFSLFRRRKKKADLSPRTSLQESRLSSSSLSSSCVPKVSMQGKRYIQIVTGQEDVRRGEIPNPLRTHPTLETVLEGGHTIHFAPRQESRQSTRAEGGDVASSVGALRSLSALNQTSVNETPPLEPVDIFEPIPSYPMLTSLSRLNSAESSSRSSIPSPPSSPHRKPFFGLVTSPLRRSIDLDHDLPAPPRLRDLNSSQVYNRSGIQSSSSSIYSIPSEPQNLTDTVATKNRALPITSNRMQKTHERKVRQLKSGLSRSRIPDSADDLSAGENRDTVRPGTLSRQSTCTRMSLDEMLKHPVERPSVKWAKSIEVKHNDADCETGSSKPPVLKKSTKVIHAESNRPAPSASPSKEFPDGTQSYLNQALVHPSASRPALVLTPATTPPYKHSPNSSHSSSTIKAAETSHSTTLISASYRPFPAPPRTSSRNSSVEKLDMTKKTRKKKKRTNSSTSTSTHSSISIGRPFTGANLGIALIEEDLGSVQEGHINTEAEAQLFSRLDALERKNRLLETAILAMLDASNTSLQKRICPIDELLSLEDETPRPSLDLNWTSDGSKATTAQPLGVRTSAKRHAGASRRRDVLPGQAVAAAVRAAANDLPSDLTTIFPTEIPENSRSDSRISFRRDGPRSSSDASRVYSHANGAMDHDNRNKVATAVEFRYSKSVETLSEASNRSEIDI